MKGSREREKETEREIVDVRYVKRQIEVCVRFIKLTPKDQAFLAALIKAFFASFSVSSAVVSFSLAVFFSFVPFFSFFSDLSFFPFLLFDSCVYNAAIKTQP